MKTTDNRFFKIIFTWDVTSFQIVNEHDETIPISVNGYWEGVLDISNCIFLNGSDIFIQRVINKDVFNKGVYTLKSLESVPECVYGGCESQFASGLKDEDYCIRLAIGHEGVLGKEIIVNEGKVDTDLSHKDSFLTLKDDFLQRIYSCCIPIDTVIKILEDATLIGKAMKILMDSHTSIYDEFGNPFYLNPLKVALDSHTPNLIQVALLHQALERIPYSYDELLELGFHDDVINALLI